MKGISIYKTSFGYLSPVPPDLGENRSHEEGQAPTERIFGSPLAQPSLPQGSRILKAAKPLVQWSIEQLGGFVGNELLGYCLRKPEISEPQACRSLKL